MKKFALMTLLLTGFLLTALTLLAPANLLAQDFSGIVPPDVPGELIYIPFPVEITLDGSLTDWREIPSYFVDYGSNMPDSPEENGSFTFAVAADRENLYITMQMPDVNIVAGQHGTDFWNEDSMEFYINASGDLGAREYGPNIFQFNINAADIGNSDPDALTLTGVNSGEHTVRGFVFKTEDGWGLETAVPLQDLLQLAHGAEIGFQAQINGATSLDRDVKLIWSKADTSDLSWQIPQLFGRAIFFELGQTDIPQPSAVEVQPTAVPTPTPAPIPAQISVNQTGYFPTGQKIASAALDSTAPVSWQLLNNSGKEVMSGETAVHGPDAASGDHLHRIDFSAYETAGSSYQITAAGLESVPFTIGENIYSTLKTDALAYFYHNRSGTPIEAQYVGAEWARPAGHTSDNSVTCFKGDDAAGHTWSGCDYTLDVSGGWYDAGDFGKYVVNGGISVWTLLNLYERFPDVYPDGSLSIPEQNNGVSDLLDEARWEMEFLLAMQVPSGQPKAGMAHHKMHDITWEPLPMVPPTEVNNDSHFEVEDEGRYLYPPSTAATLNLAATAAQCARIWAEIDPDFAARCLMAAETAWEAAQANPNIYAGNTPGAGGGNYEDGVVADEFYWAAAELFITTGKESYKTYLLDSDQFGTAVSFDWGNTAVLGTISLLTTENKLPKDKAAQLKENVLTFADNFITIQNNEGYGVLIEGDYPWGSNGGIANNMILMAQAYDISGEEQYLAAVRLSMDYLMGRNPVNQSYVSGYGTYAMQHPHHRFWANDLANGFPPPPPGALSGGPNSNPTDPAALDAGVTAFAPAKRYVDDIGSYSTNEVTINWNAPLAWVATYLDETSAGTAAAPSGGFPVLWAALIAVLLVLAVVVWLMIKRNSAQVS